MLHMFLVFFVGRYNLPIFDPVCFVKCWYNFTQSFSQDLQYLVVNNSFTESAKSIPWILAEFRHNGILQSPLENYFKMCRQHKENWGLVKTTNYTSQQQFCFFQLPPYIMCVQYRGGCSVPWRCSVPWEDIMSTVGGCLEYRGGYHDKCGGYLEYRGGVQYRGDIMSTVGVILSTVGDFQYRGDIMMHVGDIMSTVGVFSTVGYSNNKRLFPPRYWTHSTVLMISPTCIMISPTALNIPHGTQDNPPQYSWYPPTVLNTPRYSRYPPHQLSWYPPTVLNTPTVLKISPHGTHDIPHGTHDIPHGTEHPTVLSTPTVLHTHYIGWLPYVSVQFNHILQNFIDLFYV